MADFPYASDRLATVFGGSGFIGRHIVRAFARRGWRVRAAMRRPDLAGFLQPAGVVGQIQSVQANLRYPDSIAAAIDGAEIVVNAVGLKRQKGRQSYDAVHVFGSDEVARAAKAAGVRALVQISGLGADSHSANGYIASKGRAEEATLAAFADATILRPSVVFGPEDEFFNRIANLATLFPAMPVIGAETKLQPVYVGDVALAVSMAIDGALRPGTTYELGGPQVMTMREATEFTLKHIARRRALISLPFPVAGVMAKGTEVASALSLGKFPQALTMTQDSVELLRLDNIVSEAAKAEGRTFAGLGIDPQGVEAIVPAYLTLYRRGGSYERSRLA